MKQSELRLTTSHSGKSRRQMVRGLHGTDVEAGSTEYFKQLLQAMFIIVLKVPVWDILIRGSITVLTILVSCVIKTAIFLFNKFESLANWIFNGPSKRKDRFVKGYAIVFGLMIGTIPNGIWMNFQNDVQYANAMRAQVPALQQMATEHAHMREQLADLGQDSGENLFKDVVTKEIERLNPSCSAEQASLGLKKFADFVVSLESKGDQFAVSSSRALSYTQFLPTYKGRFDRGPMDTGLTRWDSYTARHDIDSNQQWFDRKNLRNNPYRFMGIPLHAQQAFMLVNIAEESGNDHNLAKAACGDARAATYLYVYKHHRDPGKEKYIWENIEDKISHFYPNHGLNFSLREKSIKAS